MHIANRHVVGKTAAQMLSMIALSKTMQIGLPLTGGRVQRPSVLTPEDPLGMSHWRSSRFAREFGDHGPPRIGSPGQHEAVRRAPGQAQDSRDAGAAWRAAAPSHGALSGFRCDNRHLLGSAGDCPDIVRAAWRDFFGPTILPRSMEHDGGQRLRFALGEVLRHIARVTRRSLLVDDTLEHGHDPDRQCDESREATR